MPARGKENGKYQGSKWLTREKRLALYLRDGLACVYCAQGIEDGVQLSLDHVVPYSQGGSHQADNVVSSCLRCNSSRADRPLAEFCDAVAGYLNHGIAGADILAHVTDCLARPYDIKAAKVIIASRGGFSLALNSFKK